MQPVLATGRSGIGARFITTMLVGVVALAVSACASHYQPKMPPPRLRTLPQLSQEPPAPLPLTLVQQSANEHSGLIAVDDGLSLYEAISMALQRHPSLTAASLEVDARAGETQQAGLLPNPDIQTDVENFGGNGPLSGFGGAETTVTVGQLIELGGKRSRRIRAADLAAQLAAWDLEAQRITVYSDITKLYVAAVAADQKATVAAELNGLAQRLLAAVDARVKAGKVSPVERQRTQIVVGRAGADRDAARAERRAAFRALATSLGASPGEVYALSGRLGPVASPPGYAVSKTFIDNSPAVARWAAEIEARQAAVDLERANRIPDVTIGAGRREFRDTNDSAYVAVFSVPLPLFNRNQGAITAAQRRLERSRAEAENARLGASVAFEQAYAALSSAATHALALQNSLLPAAKTTFDATQTGYREGKFDLVTLLDAQRTYFDMETETIAAVAAYYAARADVEALVGRDLAAISPRGAAGDE